METFESGPKSRFVVLLVAGFIFCIAMPTFVFSKGYVEKKVKTGGSISGTVFVKSDVPKPKTINVKTDQKIAGDTTREINVVKVKNGKLTNAVVYLVTVKAGKAWPKLPGSFAIEQKNARFIAKSLVLHNRKRVVIKNSDPVMHNLHAYELIGRSRRTIFNRGQVRNTSMKITFKVRKSSYVKLECDVHDYMHLNLFVAKNPYYSVTDENGKFSITDIPAGNYRIAVWHPVLGEKKIKIKVEKQQSLTQDFSF